MDWYPRFPARYDRDTLHLTLAEHGAYCRLIDFYMQSELALPDDDRQLAAILRCPMEDWMRVAPAVRRYFNPIGGRLYQRMCETQLETQSEKKGKRVKANRKNGLKGGRPKRNEINDEEPNGLSPETQSNPQTDRQTDRQTDKQEASLLVLVSDDTRDPVDVAFGAYNAMATEAKLPLAQALTPERRTSLKLRLKEAGGIDGWTDALAKVRASSWCCGAKGWRANLDFLLQKSSFRKLMEGNYDDAPGHVRRSAGAESTDAATRAAASIIGRRSVAEPRHARDVDAADDGPPPLASLDPQGHS